ncbi:MAG: hypothetical protein ACHQ0J_05990 [Candidatus Dormibacterales bacterium]
MHGLIGTEMGWLAVPAVFVVGAAYVFIVDRLLNRSTRVQIADKSTQETKAAKAA